MSALITGKLPNEPENNALKNLTQSVCFSHWSITEFTQNKKSYHTVSNLINGQLPNLLKIHSSKMDTT